MLVTRGRAARTALVMAAMAASSLAHAANDCEAEVKFVSVKPAGAGVVVEFAVETKKCDMSAGRFTYTYEASTRPGRPIDRSVQSWKSADGRKFKWTDTMTPGAGVTVSNVKVVESSIESTKIK